MKKFIVVAGALVLSAVAGDVLAAPLTEYDLGRANFQIGVNTVNDMKAVFAHNTLAGVNELKGGEKTRPYFGATAGIGGNFALQYRYEQMKAEPGVAVSTYFANEYNLRYGLDKYLSFYFGDYHAKFHGSSSNVQLGDRTRSHDYYHGGATVVVPLLKKLSAWADLGAGKDIYHYEIGVSYKVSKVANVDLSYKYVRLDEVGEFGNGGTNVKLDGKNRGIRLGLSFDI